MLNKASDLTSKVILSTGMVFGRDIVFVLFLLTVAIPILRNKPKKALKSVKNADRKKLYKKNSNNSASLPKKQNRTVIKSREIKK